REDHSTKCAEDASSLIWCIFWVEDEGQPQTPMPSPDGWTGANHGFFARERPPAELKRALAGWSLQDRGCVRRGISGVPYCPNFFDSLNVSLTGVFVPGVTAVGVLPSFEYMPIGVPAGGGPLRPSYLPP